MTARDRVTTRIPAPIATGDVVIARMHRGRGAMVRERVAPGESYAVLVSSVTYRPTAGAGIGAVRVGGVVVEGVPFRRAPREVQP